jgi:hypothetical protein
MSARLRPLFGVGFESAERIALGYLTASESKHSVKDRTFFENAY